MKITLPEMVSNPASYQFHHESPPGEADIGVTMAAVVTDKAHEWEHIILSRHLCYFELWQLEDRPITYILNLGDDRYELVKPIPVSVDRDPEGGWIACLDESSTTMPGDSREDAISALVHDILDAYDLYSSDHENLGPGPSREWSALSQYVRYR